MGYKHPEKHPEHNVTVKRTLRSQIKVCALAYYNPMTLLRLFVISSLNDINSFYNSMGNI